MPKSNNEHKQALKQLIADYAGQNEIPFGYLLQLLQQLVAEARDADDIVGRRN